MLGAQDPAGHLHPVHDRDLRGATVVGLVSAVAIRQRINLFDQVIVLLLGGLTALIAGMVWYLSQYLSRSRSRKVSQLVSNLLLLSIIVAFLLGGLRRKINVYEAFIEGAKGGIQTHR